MTKSYLKMNCPSRTRLRGLTLTTGTITIPLLLVGIFLKPLPTQAVSTVLWEVRSPEQFRKGEAKGVSITPDGEVVLSPPLSPLCSTEELYIWCLAQGLKGELYAGTGNGGKVFKIVDNKASLHFEPPGAQTYSLAVDSRGNLYVGSSPEGVVHKVTPEGGASVFFETGEKYIWSMVFDNTGNLYVGCGETGKIYSVNRGGKGTVLYDSEERHVMSLVWDRGKLYAGTEGEGLVYEITRDGQARGVFDPPEQEVKALLLDSSGNIYAAATTGEAAPETEEAEEKPATDQDRKSAIYKISSEGVFTQVWNSPDHRILSLCFDPQGGLLAGTGDEGRLYRIDPENGTTDLLKCEEPQILSLLPAKKGVYLGTGNMGKVYRLGSGYRRTGELTSDVWDTRTVSKWGRISWTGETRGGTAISLESRTGNAEEVDRTWSGWSRRYSNGDRIDSPPARFIQWRAILSTSKREASPVLNRVQVAYLPQNLRPKISRVIVFPPEVGVGTGARGMSSVLWRAEDPNGDSLLYTLYFKGVEEREWKPLKEDLVATSYTLDSFSLPDGYYRVKVLASDLLDNTEATALTAERVSRDFVVDNSPPKVRGLEVDPKSGEVGFEAEDELSLLSECRYSIDGGEWRNLFPSDGIFDSKREQFRFRLNGLRKGEHTIAVGVMDRFSNVGSSKRVFHIK